MGNLLVVDGYNVIFADAHLSQLVKSYSLQEAREELVRHCEREESVKWERIVVVFDGQKGVRSPGHGTGEGSVEVQFARTSADAVIERLVHDVRQDAAQQVTVVTNDRMIRQMVRGNGAFPITVAEFFATDMPSGTSRSRNDYGTGEQDNRISDMLPKDVVERLSRISSENMSESDEEGS